MGILDFTTGPKTNASNNRPFAGMTNVNDRPKAKVWLNIGYEQNAKFVNLPIGMPVDTMEPTDLRGQNEDWIKFQTARNALLKALQSLGDQLTPGQEIEVPNLVIKLRRVNEAVEVDKDANEYSVDLMSLLTGAKPNVEAPIEGDTKKEKAVA